MLCQQNHQVSNFILSSNLIIISCNYTMPASKRSSSLQKSNLLKKLEKNITDLKETVEKSDEKIKELEQLQTDRLYTINSFQQLSIEEQKTLKIHHFDIVTTYYHLSKAQVCFDFVCGQKDKIVSLHNKVVRGHKLLHEKNEALDLNQKFQ